jgi:hypothetical protein
MNMRRKPSKPKAKTTKQAQTRRKGMKLAIATALILIVNFGIQELLKDRVKNLADSIKSGMSLYRTELGMSTLTLNSIALNETNQLKEIEGIISPQVEGERDYSDTIRRDLVMTQQLLGDLGSSVDDVARLLDTLPPNAEDLRKQLSETRSYVSKTDEQVGNVLQPSPEHDWKRAVNVKLALISEGVAEIQVAVLGDQVLTRAQKIKDAAETIYRFLQWVVYILYAMVVILGVYAARVGIKGVGGGE